MEFALSTIFDAAQDDGVGGDRVLVETHGDPDEMRELHMQSRALDAADDPHEPFNAARPFLGEALMQAARERALCQVVSPSTFRDEAADRGRIDCAGAVLVSTFDDGIPRFRPLGFSSNSRDRCNWIQDAAVDLCIALGV